jgi:hypothetical protein
MLEVGRALLHQRAPGADVQLGYHLPPFNSVDHLHLHCFALPFKPAWKSIKYTDTLVGQLWYLSADALLQVCVAAAAELEEANLAAACASCAACLPDAARRAACSASACATLPAAARTARWMTSWSHRQEDSCVDDTARQSAVPARRPSAQPAVDTHTPLMLLRCMFWKNVLTCWVRASQARRTPALRLADRRCLAHLRHARRADLLGDALQVLRRGVRLALVLRLQLRQDLSRSGVRQSQSALPHARPRLQPSTTQRARRARQPRDAPPATGWRTTGPAWA